MLATPRIICNQNSQIWKEVQDMEGVGGVREKSGNYNNHV